MPPWSDRPIIKITSNNLSYFGADGETPVVRNPNNVLQSARLLKIRHGADVHNFIKNDDGSVGYWLGSVKPRTPRELKWPDFIWETIRIFT